MLYAQVGQHHLARTTETSPKRSSGHLSCLSARPPDLADAARTRPRVVSVFRELTVPFVYSKRAAAARSLVSRYRRTTIERFVAVTSQPAVELPVTPTATRTAARGSRAAGTVAGPRRTGISVSSPHHRSCGARSVQWNRSRSRRAVRHGPVLFCYTDAVCACSQCPLSPHLCPLPHLAQ